jgi:hypothetical protein
MRTFIVLVVIGLVGEVVAACAARSTSETDEIAVCQSKGGRWNDEGCSAGHCELPNGASPSSASTQALGRRRQQ